MVTGSDWITWSGVAVLLIGLLYAAVADWRTREVTDTLWVLLGAVGTVLGLLAVLGEGWVAIGLWVLVAALVLEHLLPWDVSVEKVHPSLAGVLELVIYGVSFGILVFAGLTWGIGPTGLSIPVIAVFVTVVLARLLFETGVLYGGADAKALMVAGLLVPVLSATVVPLTGNAAQALDVFPFSITLLMNAALLALAIPVALAVRNARAHEFEWPRGFTGYKIPVEELPRRFVWLRDPTFSRELTAEEKAVETAEEDQALRVRQMEELRAQGVTRVWVTPQIPFVILLAAGAFASVLFGNLLFDLLSAL